MGWRPAGIRPARGLRTPPGGAGSGAAAGFALFRLTATAGILARDAEAKLAARPTPDALPSAASGSNGIKL